MGKTHAPRRGSVQFWPRKRSSRPYSRVHARTVLKDVKPLEFAGYKAGMTHMMVKETNKNSPAKNMTISVPVTVIECPDMRVAGVRFMIKKGYGSQVSKDILCPNFDKELAAKINLPKKKVSDFTKELDSAKTDDVFDIKILVYTKPKDTKIGKKKPEIFEMYLGGTLDEKIEYVKSNYDKPIAAKDVFQPGDYIDVHSVTKGKGFQGPVKRFGVDIRSRKSEKTKRGPGSLGGWVAQGHSMYRIPHAGKTGYNPRVDYNKRVMSVSSDVADVNPAGGFVGYGFVKSNYLLIKGSVPGPKKRLIRLVSAIRLKPKKEKSAPQVLSVSKMSQQGR